jgi:hypothetical protein
MSKKFYDFSYNIAEKNEFLCCGENSDVDNHYYVGFLNVNRFK